MAGTVDEKKFGDFVGRKRTQLGLTQGALAEAVGISRPYLAQIEGGQRLPSNEVMQNILIHIGLPMEDFITEVLGGKLTDDERTVVLGLTGPLEWLAGKLTAEEIIELTAQMQSLEQMAAGMNQLQPEPMQVGPEGWADLKAEDKRLVQRLVNRLRSKP